jgi:hypothetical protein
MGKPATQLAVAKSADAAETVAAAVWDLAASMNITTARDASAQRMLRRFCRELCEVHDLKPDEVLGDYSTTGVTVNRLGEFAENGQG